MSSSASLISGEVAERYVIEGEIGRGGTAVVYRARDRVRGMMVAIKVLRDDATRSIDLDRFRFEIRQLSQLSHPHIVPVLDSGEVEGRPYYVLPYLEGGTLRGKLRANKQLPFDEVIAIGVTIARALDFAHSHGLIHRDVKPENILFNDGQACLADFGTARHVERVPGDPSTSTGMVPGTAAYMSPEQASGEQEYDGRSDIYSLACVLYECIAGIQPFVGPTMQAVISQRLAHAPRPVSVYRPTVPPALEQVLVKATAITPADRFARASALADELEGVSATGFSEGPSPGARTIRARRLIVSGLIAITAIAAIGLTAKSRGWSPFGERIPLDTTLVAVMPVEVTGSISGDAGQDLFTEGLRRWSGVSFVETFAVNDAVRRKSHGLSGAQATASLSIDDVADIARSLGAGRFIRAQLNTAAGTRALYATLYDVRSGKDLFHARLSFPEDTTKWSEVYADLTDSLMLRGATDASRRVRRRVPLNLAAYQLFVKARSALGEWDLATAESLLLAASVQDSANAPASLWLAQVRQWRGRSESQWALAAQRALRDSTMLTQKEWKQGQGLLALATRRYADACRIYRAMVRSNPADFTAQYGLGDCSRLDRVIVRDSTSPSGYAFRASYEQAIQGFRRAYELLPSAHRTVQTGAFEPLRTQLFTQYVLRRGGLDGQSESGFYARISLDHDTVVFVPYPRDSVMAGPPQTDPRVVGAALTRNRKIFHDVVASWRAVLPDAIGTREAFAVSLEMLGDPAAADSFAALRSQLARSDSRLRLAAEEAIVRMKLGISGRDGQLSRSRAIIDSLLRETPASQSEAELLVPLAAIVGRCERAAQLGQSIRLQTTRIPVPPSVLDSTQQSLLRWSAGCTDALRFPDITGALRQAGISARDAAATEYELTGAVVAMDYPASESAIRRLANEATDYVLRAEAYLFDQHPDSARRILSRYRDARLVAPPGDLPADAAFVEAKLWLALGDSLTARQLISKLISELDHMQPLVTGPGSSLPNTLRLGAIVSSLELLVRLETDSTARSRQASTLATIRSSADQEVRRRLRPILPL